MRKYDIVFTIAQTVLVTLKLIGVIPWSWWWVFAPSWIPFALLLMILTATYINKTTKQMKKFKTQEIRDLLNQVYKEEISFSRMVEEINQRVSEAEEKCVEDIPKRKFQKGDKVRIKEGISSRTVQGNHPSFRPSMDGFIGTTMTVSGYNDYGGYVVCNESDWRFNEDWLEPYTDELKKGDLAIFWDENKEYAKIGIYLHRAVYHYDHSNTSWENATKFESKEQYEKLLKGEI